MEMRRTWLKDEKEMIDFMQIKKFFLFLSNKKEI